MGKEVIANPMAINKTYQFTYVGGEKITYTVIDVTSIDYGVSFCTEEIFRIPLGCRIQVESVLIDPHVKPSRENKIEKEQRLRHAAYYHSSQGVTV